MVTPIITQPIAGADAWTSRELGGKEALERCLTDAELRAFRETLERIAAKDRTAVTAADFAHPDLRDILQSTRNEVMNGRGVAIIRGIDTAAWSQSECERIFWGFGQHLGYAAVQSSRGDRIGYVRNEPDDPKRRGYRSSGELVLHTDSREIIALMALKPAASGGETFIASAAAIHNVILRERPDLLPALYRGHRYHSTEVGVTECEIPIFSNVDGKLSCMFFEEHIRKAAKTMDVALPADLDEALHYFALVARREDVCIEFLLKPGEMIFCNNFTVLHARNKFEDSQETQRLLARLWINVANGRPTIPQLHVRSRWFDEHHDPVYMKRASA